MFHFDDQTQRVTQAAGRATFRNLGHAAARISKDVKASLVTAEGPSDPGEPPHTHQGAYLRRAVRYAAEKDGAVIGPVASLVGQAGAAHEFGEELHGQDYPERSGAIFVRQFKDKGGGSWDIDLTIGNVMRVKGASRSSARRRALPQASARSRQA